MKRHLPNLVTLSNLFCGCVAVVYAIGSDFVMASFFVFLGIFFDFFDGFLARKLNVQSPLGLQLDSLADMVTSGLVPGIVMFRLLAQVLPSWGALEVNTVQFPMVALLGFLIPLGSAYRLAKFNIDTEQQTYFKGLPTPANALLILSLPLIIAFQDNETIRAIIMNKWALISMTLLSTYLLNAPIKLFALKFKTWRFRDNLVRYIFIILAIVFLVVFRFLALPMVIFLYVGMSFIQNNIK